MDKSITQTNYVNLESATGQNRMFISSSSGVLGDNVSSNDVGCNRKKSKKKWVTLPLDGVTQGQSHSLGGQRLDRGRVGRLLPDHVNAWKSKKGSDLFSKKGEPIHINEDKPDADNRKVESGCMASEYTMADTVRIPKQRDDELLELALQESLRTAQQEEAERKQTLLVDLASIPEDDDLELQESTYKENTKVMEGPKERASGNVFVKQKVFSSHPVKLDTRLLVTPRIIKRSPNASDQIINPQRPVDRCQDNRSASHEENSARKQKSDCGYRQKNSQTKHFKSQYLTSNSRNKPIQNRIPYKLLLHDEPPGFTNNCNIEKQISFNQHSKSKLNKTVNRDDEKHATEYVKNIRGSVETETDLIPKQNLDPLKERSHDSINAEKQSSSMIESIIVDEVSDFSKENGVTELDKTSYVVTDEISCASFSVSNVSSIELPIETSKELASEKMYPFFWDPSASEERNLSCSSNNRSSNCSSKNVVNDNEEAIAQTADCSQLCDLDGSVPIPDDLNTKFNTPPDLLYSEFRAMVSEFLRAKENDIIELILKRFMAEKMLPENRKGENKDMPLDYSCPVDNMSSLPTNSLRNPNTQFCSLGDQNYVNMRDSMPLPGFHNGRSYSQPVEIISKSPAPQSALLFSNGQLEDLKCCAKNEAEYLDMKNVLLDYSSCNDEKIFKEPNPKVNNLPPHLHGSISLPSRLSPVVPPGIIPRVSQQSEFSYGNVLQTISEETKGTEIANLAGHTRSEPLLTPVTPTQLPVGQKAGSSATHPYLTSISQPQLLSVRPISKQLLAQTPPSLVQHPQGSGNKGAQSLPNIPYQIISVHQSNPAVVTFPKTGGHPVLLQQADGQGPQPYSGECQLTDNNWAEWSAPTPSVEKQLIFGGVGTETHDNNRGNIIQPQQMSNLSDYRLNNISCPEQGADKLNLSVPIYFYNRSHENDCPVKEQERPDCAYRQADISSDLVLHVDQVNKGLDVSCKSVENNNNSSCKILADTLCYKLADTCLPREHNSHAVLPGFRTNPQRHLIFNQPQDQLYPTTRGRGHLGIN